MRRSPRAAAATTSADRGRRHVLENPIRDYAWAVDVRALAASWTGSPAVSPRPSCRTARTLRLVDDHPTPRLDRIRPRRLDRGHREVSEPDPDPDRRCSRSTQLLRCRCSPGSEQARRGHARASRTPSCRSTPRSAATPIRGTGRSWWTRSTPFATLAGFRDVSAHGRCCCGCSTSPGPMTSPARLEDGDPDACVPAVVEDTLALPGSVGGAVGVVEVSAARGRRRGTATPRRTGCWRSCGQLGGAATPTTPASSSRC